MIDMHIVDELVHPQKSHQILHSFLENNLGQWKMGDLGKDDTVNGQVFHFPFVLTKFSYLVERAKILFVSF